MSSDNSIRNESYDSSEIVVEKHTFTPEEKKKKFDLFNQLLGNISIDDIINDYG